MRPETRPALRDERRLVTALFADISGFSELAARLDAERLQEVIDPVIAALSNVVGRYEGVIEKYAGDALMALFGAPVAHDDDAARALHTALDMHRELARLVPQLPPEAANLRLHIGVNSGHGIARVIGSEVRFDYAVLGDVVVLAQRLEAATPVGETYVGAATQQLTARDFELEPVGELAVKGKQEPVPAWRLVGPRSHREHAPAAAADARALVGRDQEMGAMNRFSARLEEGAGGAVFVLGEAGVGKTTLCQSLRARAVAQGWDWLAARCLSYGGELAYWPYADLLRRTLGTVDLAPSEALDRVTAELAAAGLEDSLPFIGSLMGLEGAPAAEISPQGFQRRLHESVVALLAARARARPTILMLDDLHWADGPTVTLTGELLAAVERLPLALVVSARPEGGATVDTLISRRPESCLRLDLQPLAADAVREIAAQVLAVPPAAELVQALLEHTGGNPFFVEEVARSLAQRGGLVERGGEWHTPAGWEQEQVPLSVEGVIAARIDALTATERSVLEVLSVVGRRADLMLARAVADVDPALPALTGVGLLDDVDPGGRHIAFHHPLTQQVVYARLLRRRRVELHRAVGEAAESLLGAEDGSVDLLARHFYVGEDAPRAFDYALRAAARAERHRLPEAGLGAGGAGHGRPGAAPRDPPPAGPPGGGGGGAGGGAGPLPGGGRRHRRPARHPRHRRHAAQAG
jgi:class 3 adenylate cyclase